MKSPPGSRSCLKIPLRLLKSSTRQAEHQFFQAGATGVVVENACRSNCNRNLDRLCGVRRGKTRPSLPVFGVLFHKAPQWPLWKRAAVTTTGSS
jgi:hypothetical protein